MIQDYEPITHGGIILSAEEFRIFCDGSFNGKIEDNKRYLIKDNYECVDLGQSNDSF